MRHIINDIDNDGYSISISTHGYFVVNKGKVSCVYPRYFFSGNDPLISTPCIPNTYEDDVEELELFYLPQFDDVFYTKDATDILEAIDCDDEKLHTIIVNWYRKNKKKIHENVESNYDNQNLLPYSEKNMIKKVITDTNGR